MSDETNGKPKKGSINDLGLGNDALEGAEFDQIPENIGQSFPDPPQPGKYRFQLPGPAFITAIWTVVETDKHGTRINGIFDSEAPLVIVQSPGKAYDGEEFSYRISNVPRERTKEKILVSDMDLLLRALGETKKPATNKAYAQALQKYAGKEFGATIEYSYNCNAKREAYFDAGDGTQQKVEGRMGCGGRWYQRDVAKVPSNPEDPQSPLVQPLRITCTNPECGASVRAFPNLTGFTK
jgi:hypothetical protein